MKCVCGCTTNGVNDNFCADCGGVLAFEEKPEFLYKYRKVLEKFIRDGELSQKDMKQLNSLQKKWNIRQSTHDALVAELTPEEQHNFGIWIDVGQMQDYVINQPCVLPISLVNNGEYDLENSTILYRTLDEEQALRKTIGTIREDDKEKVNLRFHPQHAGQYDFRGVIKVVDITDEESHYRIRSLGFRVAKDSSAISNNITINQTGERIYTQTDLDGLHKKKDVGGLLGKGDWFPVRLQMISEEEFQAFDNQEDHRPGQEKAANEEESKTLHARGKEHETENEYQEAVRCYRQAAKLGYPPAQTALGDCYDAGKGVDQDYEESIKWYRRAAEQEYPAAIRSIGHCYSCGDGVEQDDEEAFQWYQKAAKLGDIAAMYSLGDCYYNGDGVEEDEEKAITWYKKTRELARQESENGNAETMYILGELYYNGDGVEEDEEKAVKWYRKAAKSGDAEAMKSLGDCYYNGDGVEEDDEKAIKWYRKAIAKENAEAMKSLGDCYYNGDGVEEDEEKAVKWYRRAAKKGDTGAICGLGLCYYNGHGVEEDEEEAMKWYKRAADNDNSEAMYRLGLGYYKGTGVTKNKRKGIKLIKKAAKDDHEEAIEFIEKKDL